ncbi:MAG: putative endopeptidase, partial [Acidobacteriaceae bacterium]|nr:putative endopeptidase [Acidobacteriaceae bacterium]
MKSPFALLIPALVVGASLAAPISIHAQTTVSEQTRIQLHGLDPALRDTAADPCVNFFQYACGTWLKRYPIPQDRSAYGIDTQLTEDNNLTLKTILEQSSDTKAQRDADTQKIGDYYATCMDTAAIDKSGVAPLQPMLDRINALGSMHDLAPLVASLQQSGAQSLFRIGSNEDYKDATHMIATVSQPRLG